MMPTTTPFSLVTSSTTTAPSNCCGVRGGAVLVFAMPVLSGCRFQFLVDMGNRLGHVGAGELQRLAQLVALIGERLMAAYDVADYNAFVRMQSEAALRTLTMNFAYDNIEDENAALTLREGGTKINDLLANELNERLESAGIIIKEARISHLAYAQEIAGAMLQRQQASAIVAARFKIVEGAVSMVELALDQLSKKDIVHLDDERKAAMVSNLMVVLCGERSAQPVLNTGTLYQ